MHSDLFAGTYARGAAAQAVSGQAWLEAMLRVEAALAHACAEEGLISKAAAEAVAQACAAASGTLELQKLAADAGEHATPVIPLVKALRERVGSEHAEAVHLGATSQDIVDTAAMLVARAALHQILADTRAAAESAEALHQQHLRTPLLGRTLLQPALEITFGLEAETWRDVLTDAADALEQALPELLAVQMGGPVGTRPPQVGARVADALELASPERAWHTNRVRVARLASGLGILAGALGKVARDVTLLAQAEVGEVREGVPGRGSSSAMAHKRNPVAAVSVLACTRRLPGLVATMLAAMEQEHQRAAGGWQAEWGTLSDALALTGSAAAWEADLLTHLRIDANRMRVNAVELSGGGA
ncbi:MAG TPA: lyase family protein [Solirubrobacteraceae bacterium]|nr:lyase family protein [Solirubrobacteraceae bacterium]